MKLIGKDNYEKQPMTMYQWRALSAALDLAFADILLGMGRVTVMDDDAVPVAAENPVVDTEEVFDQPTAAQEEVQAMEQHKEEVEAQQSGGTSEEMIKVLQDIEDKLASLCKGDMEAMMAMLKHLTTYTPKGSTVPKWVQMADLSGIAKYRPQWILGIHKKVKAEFEKEFGATAPK